MFLHFYLLPVKFNSHGICRGRLRFYGRVVAIFISGCHRCPLQNWLRMGVGVNFCFHIV